MSKLLKLRQWLSLSEASRSLSTLVGEEVAAADLLRLAIDRHLTLSVHFVNGVYLRQRVLIEKKAVKWVKVPSSESGGVERYVDGGDICLLEDGSMMQQMGPVIFFQPSVFDLPMTGGEVRDVEREYQRMMAGPIHIPLPHRNISVRSDSGYFFEVHTRKVDSGFVSNESPFSDPLDFTPAESLPDDAVFVIRTESLTALQAKLADPETVKRPTDQPSTRERETLLKLIVGMAVACYRYDPAASRNDASAEISSDLAKQGIPVTDDTVRKWLKEAAATCLPTKSNVLK